MLFYPPCIERIQSNTERPLRMLLSTIFAWTFYFCIHIAPKNANMNPAKLWFYLRNLLFAYLAVKRLYLFFAEGRIIDLMVGLLFVGLVIYDLRSAFSQK